MSPPSRGVPGSSCPPGPEKNACPRGVVCYLGSCRSTSILLSVLVHPISGRTAHKAEGFPFHSMTPLQFALAECANYDQSTSACKGLGINKDCSLFSFGAKPACVLSNRQPCAYFAECVLPIGTDTNSTQGIARARSIDEARTLYARFDPSFSKKKGRKCQACRRREVEKHHRLCYVCAEERKKASDRSTGAERQARARQSRKTPSIPLATIGQNDGANVGAVCP